MLAESGPSGPNVFPVEGVVAVAVGHCLCRPFLLLTHFPLQVRTGEDLQ